MDGPTSNGDGKVDLIPQPHGGALRPPVKKGEVRNPWGRPSRRVELARELAKRAGLDELVELAFQARKRRGAVARALLEAATDPNHKGQVPAQRLLWDLLGQTKEADELRARLDVEVRYTGKVRDMGPAEDATFEVKDDAPPANGNGHA